MIELQTKIRRFERLRDVQERQLLAAAQELGSWDAKIAEVMKLLESNEQEHRQALAGGKEHTLHTLTQGVHWGERWNQRHGSLKKQLQDLDSRRSVALVKVTEHRKALRSWDSLLDRLKDELQGLLSHEQSIEAEEHYLRNKMGSARS